MSNGCAEAFFCMVEEDFRRFYFPNFMQMDILLADFIEIVVKYDTN